MASPSFMSRSQINHRMYALNDINDLRVILPASSNNMSSLKSLGQRSGSISPMLLHHDESPSALPWVLPRYLPGIGSRRPSYNSPVSEVAKHQPVVSQFSLNGSPVLAKVSPTSASGKALGQPFLRSSPQGPAVLKAPNARRMIGRLDTIKIDGGAHSDAMSATSRLERLLALAPLPPRSSLFEPLDLTDREVQDIEDAYAMRLKKEKLVEATHAWQTSLPGSVPA